MQTESAPKRRAVDTVRSAAEPQQRTTACKIDREEREKIFFQCAENEEKREVSALPCSERERFANSMR